MNILDQVKQLHDQKLYSNVTCLVNMLMTVSENNAEFISAAQKLQMMMIYADSLYQLQEFCKAEDVYQKALQLKKSLMKNKGKSQTMDVVSDVDIKFNIYLCYYHMNQFAKAINMLESISGKQRTVKVSMALAKLHHENGQERSAITCYKEVLKECPLAIEAALGLLALGVKGFEVASLVLAGTTGVSNMEWISIWIKAHGLLYYREFSLAAAAFQQLDTRSILQDNVSMLVALGKAHYYDGEYKQSLAVLRRANAIDPLNMDGMDLLSSLLCKEKELAEAEKLATHLMSVNDRSAEPWIAVGNYILSTKTVNRAIFYAKKACTLKPHNVEALLLKGNVLYQLRKFQDAVSAYREALRLSPYRFEAHEGLVNCYKDLHRRREAVTIASNACKQLGQVPRTLLLYASVLATVSISVDKAVTCLEKALKLDPSNLDIVFQLAQIYLHESLYEKGIELLKEQVEIHSSSRLHYMLADFFTKNNEHEKALEHFSAALSLNHENSSAIEGLQKVEQLIDSRGSTYNMEVEDSPDTDIDAEFDDSEMETTFSD